MSRFWSSVVGELSPYVPGEQPKLPDLVKLNTNEHPWGPSPKVLQAMQAACTESLKLYPDPGSERLRAAVAAHCQVQPDQVFIGNGSDEILAHTFLALLKHDGPLLFPDITYSFYPVYCGLYRINYEAVPLTADFGIDVRDYLPEAGRNAGAIIFPNPNAPTGRALPLADIERILSANPDIVVVIDEAYVDFGAESATQLVSRYENLLVIQTLSKSRSLAGLRVGFAVGNRVLIEALERVKNSFNSYPIDRIAEAGAIAAIEDKEYFEQACQYVINTRETLVADLQALGFEVLPSAANFVFARHPAHDGAKLAAALRERSIIVRHFKSPRIDQFLRITVGTESQCARLIETLKTVLAV
ncbi:histidinol-phosphate transaminase [Bordetella sp. 15P40C-2]|uniref:histidinol-phosphate transaminase n=1 Tax=Bordetella sp. 15P40C-2 TaxID=2572246 RepID=UPI0013250472|nr:histidinol-phosphate transaminase [Bordetella sp. 15P40C-2]MVW72215.1 histidinol-phosphate transaminase [Bordetella sp. 15P40C-2]